jgi:lipopolysaccharide export system ATP-binding protein
VTEATVRAGAAAAGHPHRRREDRLGKSLAVSELFKRYRRREVVRGVSLSTSPGEVVGLLGPNGAGKTTIFYMMVGLVRPDAGEVVLNGRQVTGMPMHRRARMGLGYLPQEPSVFRKLSVRDNILVFLEETGLSRGERKERLESILRDMRIDHVADTMGFALSGGERRRVEIARSLVLSPDFLLLDEPFAGIDPISVADLQQVILGLKERGIGVIITDHNVRDTLKVCDRAYIISEGRILLSGTPSEIAASDQVREIYLGDGFSL